MRTFAARLAAALLTSSALACGAGDGVGPDAGPLPAAALGGKWKNENSATLGITRLEISVRPAGILVEEWGACHPIECSWGQERADSRRWDGERSLTIVWNQGFAVEIQTLTDLDAHRLRLTTFTHFLDGSGRADRELTEFFRKE